MKKLFDEFDPVDKSEWLERISKDLKGKPLDALRSQPENDLEIAAYHHRDDLNQNNPSYSNPLNRGFENNSWKIRMEFDPNAENNVIMEALNSGVDHLGLRFKDAETFRSQTKDILFEHISADLFLDSIETVDGLKDLENIDLNFDVIAKNISGGKWNKSLDEFYSLYANYHGKCGLWISGDSYGNAGASTIQELALTISHLNEYMHFLSEQGVSAEELSGKINIALSVGQDYFVNIAKFRVIHELVALLFKGYSVDNGNIGKIYAKTGVRFITQNDSYTNLLRETTQAMSAILGGCDVLSIIPASGGNPKENAQHARMAKNIQLVLKEESYLDKVVDPAAGSYYIENLSDQILSKSWELFKEIEKEGGLIQAVKENRIQERIDRNKHLLIDKINEGKKTFLGVNKYQNPTEEWISSNPLDLQGEYEFMPLTEFRMEDYFEKKPVSHG